MEFRKGDIYYADLSPVVGCEQGGVRPVLLIQNRTGNRFSPTVVVAAITGRKKKRMSTHVDLPKQAGLKKASVVMLEQIRTIDRSRLERYVGRLDEDRLAAVDRALVASFGLKKSYLQNKDGKGDERL